MESYSFLGAFRFPIFLKKDKYLYVVQIHACELYILVPSDVSFRQTGWEEDPLALHSLVSPLSLFCLDMQCDETMDGMARKQRMKDRQKTVAHAMTTEGCGGGGGKWRCVSNFRSSSPSGDFLGAPRVGSPEDDSGDRITHRTHLLLEYVPYGCSSAVNLVSDRGRRHRKLPKPTYIHRPYPPYPISGFRINPPENLLGGSRVIV